MEIGVQLPEVERRVPWTEYAEMALAAEAGGFDSLWVGDHLLYDLDGGGARGPWECWTVLAGLAAVTHEVQIGPLVASTSFHAPAMLAKQAATVDEISGGRLVLGLGAGWNEREYRAFGFPYDRRVGRFAEAFTIIRTLIRDGRSTFRGAFYEVDDCVLDPPARAGLPIMVGSIGPRMLSLTIPHVDMWNVWFADYGNDPGRLTPLISRVDAAARAAGRQPDEIEHTVTLLVQTGDNPTRRHSENPIRSRTALWHALDRLVGLGIGHVQLVLDPITVASINGIATSIARWRSER